MFFQHQSSLISHKHYPKTLSINIIHRCLFLRFLSHGWCLLPCFLGPVGPGSTEKNIGGTNMATCCCQLRQGAQGALAERRAPAPGPEKPRPENPGGKPMGKPGKIRGKPWENQGKTRGKPWENPWENPWQNHGKTMGKSGENHGKIRGNRLFFP